MSRGNELVIMDFSGIVKSKENASEIKYGAPRLNEKSIHWIKPWMVQKALSRKGLCDEYCNSPKVLRDSEDLKFEVASRKMNGLFPQRTSSGSNPKAEQNIATFENSSIDRSAYTAPRGGKQSPAQLTIIYNGIVNVYDVFEKQAEAIIRLAGNEISSQQLHSAGFDRRTPQVKPITVSSTSTSNETEEPLSLNPSNNSAPQQVVIQKINTDLPLQRKQSLQRFLQKRKDFRMNRAAPYSLTRTESVPRKAVNQDQNAAARLSSALHPSKEFADSAMKYPNKLRCSCARCDHHSL